MKRMFERLGRYLGLLSMILLVAGAAFAVNQDRKADAVTPVATNLNTTKPPFADGAAACPCGG
jgi:hypothetical protein